MPPQLSKHSRTDHSASADFTPRGYRNPRGQRPHHTPRGGRSKYRDKRQRQPRRPEDLEQRTRAIDDAFHAPLDSVRTNSLVFSQCIAQVLRKQGGIKDKGDHDSALADGQFENLSRHLSYVFRHTNLIHSYGSLSLHELLHHQGTARKIRSLYREGMRSLQIYDDDHISMRLRDRGNTFSFLMPLAHVICDSNKARAMIGYVSVDDFQPGVTPTPDKWFKTAEFGDDTARDSQADILLGVDIASIFIRFESGHSTEVDIDHCPFVPEMFPRRYLVHGTNEKNIQSIRNLGLLPGGTRGGRNHVHFILDSQLSTIKDAIRPESDCILIARPGAVSGLSPVITHNRYVLTDQTVPYNRFCGCWSFVDRAWLDVPEPAELTRMNDYTSDINIAMHVCHHQLYWEKRTENDQDGISWTRSEYEDYVAEKIQEIPVVSKFLEGFRSVTAGPSRPVRSGATPNDQERGPPENEEDKKVNSLRNEIAARFKKHLEKARNQEISSASETEAPKRKIQSKPMPKRKKDAADTATSPKASDAASSASAFDLHARSPWGGRKTVKQTMARREASTQAKELFRDAEAAKKFFSEFKKKTEEISWFGRPSGPQCCKNFADCNCSEAMFWCHPCGFAYCLECRIGGLACDHNIVNYSSELPSEFLPDSIGSSNSPFDIGVLIDAVLSEATYFGATRREHAQNRQEHFKDLITHLREGQALGNTYLKSFARHGIEQFDYTGYIYTMPSASRVPSLQEHFLDAQGETPLPIWRPEVFFKYPEGKELSEAEIFRLLELFRSCLLGKRAVQGVVKRTKKNIHDFQRDTYQLAILTLNLGHINRVPYIGGSSKFPKWVRTDINYRVLPHLVFRNAAHIVCLCEASDEYGGIAVHRELASEYGMIGMVVHPAINSQSVAIFIRGDHDVGTFIELLGHHQIQTGSKSSPFWILHGAIFRLVHGENTSGEFVDPSTGVRIPKPDVTKNLETAVQQHPRPLATTLDFLDHSICEIDGDEDLAVNGVEVCEVNPGADTHDVRRLLMAESRVAVCHISSYAWKDAYQETCQKWLGFVANCVEHQCDFITGDGNLFAQRSFKSDDHSDFRTSIMIMIDILERFLQQINLHRSPINRITYNVVSSTTAADYIRSMEGEDAECDSMLCISLCYGKQTAVTEARAKEDSASADGYSGSAFSDEVLLTDVEQLKHLLPYDLGLAEKDCAWHSPLLTFAQLKALKNMRIRTKGSEDRRRERWGQRTQIYQERNEERRERQDSVPPLRRDTYRRVGEYRSRSTSRARSNNPKARTPQPPPAPARAPVTPPDPPRTTTATPQPVRYKAAPIGLTQAPTSTSNLRPPVKAPPAKAMPTTPPAPPARSRGTARSPSNPPDQPRTTASKSRPPWREASQNAEQRQTTRKRPHNVPEPPAPPSRMTGTQWLDRGSSSSGAQWLDHGASSSSTGHRGYGYDSGYNYEYEQQPYYRSNPRTLNVEYVPGYTIPRQRWVQKYDGTWLDMLPQTPDASIFYHQAGELRRRNEMNLYGYTFSMGL